ncbi:hypothetical protein [Armatimonas sp.]|uniref:hypothetical protein n=1 Tax=Armatimonas sp. TaxID=1872638 RepID=UPI00374C950F
MTRGQSAQITRTRLNKWGGRLEQHTATPMVMLSISHDTATGGQCILSTTEDLTNEELILFVSEALNLLREQVQS